MDKSDFIGCCLTNVERPTITNHNKDHSPDSEYCKDLLDFCNRFSNHRMLSPKKVKMFLCNKKFQVYQVVVYNYCLTFKHIQAN